MPTKVSDLEDDKTYDSRINAAQSKAEEGVTKAGTAQAAAEAAQNKADVADGKADKNAEDIKALQEADVTLGGKITALETTVNNETSGVAANYAAITKNAGDISALSATVGTHTTDIAGLKTSTANNGTAITNLQTAVSNVYTKTEADGKFVVQESGKSLISTTEIERLAGINNYDDSAIRALITNITKEGGAIATAVAAEAAIARAAEKANADEIARVNGVLVAALENDAEGLDSIKELADWINTHGAAAADMSKAITANAEAIAAIYTPAEGETAASGVLVTEIANAKTYADNSIAAALASYKVKDVDNTTLQLENGVASVKAVSTDLLVQGENELILSAGNATGYITV